MNGSEANRFHPNFTQSLALLLLLVPAYLAMRLLEAFVGLLPLHGIRAVLPEFRLPLALVVVFWLGAKWTNRPLRLVAPFRAVRPAATAWFVVAQVGASLLVSQINARIAEVLPSSLTPTPDGLGAIFTMLSVPTAEELLFRGLILGGYLGCYGRWRAIWASALLFAAFHLNLGQLAPALLAGLLYGWVVALTGSLWWPVLGHILHNTWVWLRAYGHLAGHQRDMDAAPWAWALGGLVLLAIGALQLRRMAASGRLGSASDCSGAT